MKSRFFILVLLAPSILLSQSTFSLKSGEQLSQHRQYGQSTQQLEAFIQSNPSRMYDHSEALLLISYNHMQLGDYANALAANEASLNIKAQLHADDLVNNFLRYGAIHLLRGNPHAALSYLLQAKEFPIEAIPLYAVIDAHLAAAYRGLGQYDQAEIFYRQSVETLLIEYPADHPEVITTYYHLGKMYQEWGKPAEARVYFQQALERLAPTSGQAALRPMLYLALGETFSEDPARAEQHFRTAQELANRHFGPYHRETAQAALALAKALARQEKRGEARDHILTAIRSLTPEQPNLSWEQLPDSTNIFIDRALLADALGLKSRWLMDAALPDEQKLPAALAHSEMAGKLLLAALDDRLDQGDRLELLPIARQALEPGMEAGIGRWKEKNDAVALERAFRLVELMKMLRFRAYTSQALQLKDEYAKRERQFHRELRLAHLKFRANPLDLTSQKDVWQRQGAYLRFKDEWQRVAPVGYHQRFGLPLLSGSAVKGQLDGETTLFSYFVGERAVYLFTVNGEGMKAYPLLQGKGQAGRPLFYDLAIDVQQLVQAIDQEDEAAFAKYGGQLYQQLVEPAEQDLRSGKAVLILPDGPLRAVPFEALLTKPQKRTSRIRFHKLPFFIKDYSVTYHHAASVWGSDRIVPRGTPAYDLLLLSPVFDQQHLVQIGGRHKILFDPYIHAGSSISNGRQFHPVLQALPEVREVQKLYLEQNKEGRFKMRESATESILQSELGKARYVHVASYGFIAGVSPEESGLVLAGGAAPEDIANDGILLSSELKPLASSATELLHIGLVEQHLDDKSREAGILPLSGSLIMAGIPNLFYQTSRDGSPFLIIELYPHLLEGLPIRKALQNAKREVIKGKEFASPKYWSTYRLIGK